MADLGDIQLDKELATTAPGRRRWRLVLGALIVAAAGALAYYGIRWYRDSRPSNVRLQTEQAVVGTGDDGAPRAEPGENIALAPLDETDPLVRELVGRLSSHPKVAAWLATDQLIRNFTVSVINIADGRSPSKPLQRLAPAGAFRAAPHDGTSYVDAQSYRRYDEYAEAVAALDARGAARLYATLEPRIQDAARELGQPHGDFDVTMERAIVHLLHTPVVEGPVAIAPAPVLWEYSDPRLAALSGAQRQLLRMGPRNVRLIQAKLREIATHLGIDPAKLPPPAEIRFPRAH